MVHKAFAKLMVEIDYPMSKWEVSTTKEYLNYSLNLLELLNSISSALSHLNQTRISISHALSVIKNSPEKLKRLKEIDMKDFGKDLRCKGIMKSEEKIFTGKGLIFHQALMDLKSIGLWVCSVLLSGLRSDVKSYMEMKKSAGEFVPSPIMALDSSVWKEMIEIRGIIREIREVNESMGNTADFGSKSNNNK